MLTAGRSFVLTAVATILAAGACSRSDRADLLTPNSPEERAKVLENADETQRRRQHDRAWEFERPRAKAVVRFRSNRTLPVRPGTDYHTFTEPKSWSSSLWLGTAAWRPPLQAGPSPGLHPSTTPWSRLKMVEWVLLRPLQCSVYYRGDFVETASALRNRSFVRSRPGRIS